MPSFLKMFGEVTYRDAFWLLFGSMMGNHVVKVAVSWFQALERPSP